MWGKLLALFLGVFAITSYKYIPLVYFLRFYKVPIKYLGLRKDKKSLQQFDANVKKNKMSLFDPVTRYTYCCPMECDFFGFHKNNCTYQTELDINRSEVILAKLYPYFLDFNKKFGSYPYVPLATIGIYFMKEIKPFQKYRIENRILSWDQKWIFLLSEFKVGDRTVALSVGKLVFKDHRKTIPPSKVIEFCGYSCDEIEKVRLENLKYVKSFVDPQDFLNLTFKP